MGRDAKYCVSAPKMDKFLHKYRIASTRLQTWDYGSQGLYFITIAQRTDKIILAKSLQIRKILRLCNQHQWVSRRKRIGKKYLFISLLLNWMNSLWCQIIFMGSCFLIRRICATGPPTNSDHSQKIWHQSFGDIKPLWKHFQQLTRSNLDGKAGSMTTSFIHQKNYQTFANTLLIILQIGKRMKTIRHQCRNYVVDVNVLLKRRKILRLSNSTNQMHRRDAKFCVPAITQIRIPYIRVWEKIHCLCSW